MKHLATRPTHAATLVTVALLTAVGACGKDTLRALTTQTDEFSQNAAAKVDILWVIDNSSSMSEEQRGLGQSFQSFIQSFTASGVDYAIGVVSTDPADGGVLHKGASNAPVITRSTTNAQPIFLENVTVGTTGALSERAFESAALALGKGRSWVPGQPATPPNAGFPRADAALFLIMVSDEDDKSFGPVRYYQRLFDSYKGPGNEGLVSVSAIVSPPGEEPCAQAARGRAAEAGERYGDLANQTGGIVTSICDDFNASLATLSITAAGLKSVFELSGQPSLGAVIRCDDAPATFLCVRIDGVPVREGSSTNDPSGWRYDETRNAVVFGINVLPKPQQRFSVEYQDVAQ